MIISYQTITLKKILVLTIFVLSLLFLLFSKNISNLFKKNKDNVVVLGERVSVFQAALKPIYGVPSRIVIGKLDLKIDVITVGVDFEGYIETPEEWNIAGWYEKSARPGEFGNMIIDGHFDDNMGRPAAFYKLKNINVGDKVSILDSYGRPYEYTVVKSFFVDINDPNRLEVLNTTKEMPALTLITCGGVWNSLKQTYNERLVVVAELVQQN